MLCVFSRLNSDTFLPLSSPQKKVKVEDASPNPFASMAGDPNMLAMGSMGLRPHPAPAAAFNPNLSLAFGTGLPMAGLVASQPMMPMSGFPGTSPGFHTAMGHHPNMFGYGPNLTMMAPPPAAAAANAAGGDSPDAHSNSNDDGSEGNHGGVAGQQRRTSSISGMSGMTPLMFAPAGMTMGHHPMMARAPAPFGHPAVMQVVSTDSHVENGGLAPAPVAMMPMAPQQLQKPKKW